MLHNNYDISDLQCAFNELYHDSLLITRKKKDIKMMVDFLKKIKDRLTQENSLLAYEYLRLKKQKQALHKNLMSEKSTQYFYWGNKWAQQQAIFLSFKHGLTGKNHKGKFNKPVCFVKVSCKTCTYYGQQGYINPFCRIKKVIYERKYRWIAKFNALLALEQPINNFTLWYLDRRYSRHMTGDSAIF